MSAAAQVDAGPAYLWQDPETGEISEEARDGWDLLYRQDVVPPPDVHQQPDSEWLGDYVTQALARIEAERDALETAHKVRLAQLESRERAIDWLYRLRLEAVVKERLKQRSKPKSVVFAFGRAGYRKSSSIEVRDEAAALEWAAQHCPAAIKHRDPYLLRKELPDDIQVPGVERRTVERFFVKPLKGGE